MKVEFYPLSNRYLNLFSLIQREIIILREHVIEKTKKNKNGKSNLFSFFIFQEG